MTCIRCNSVCLTTAKGRHLCPLDGNDPPSLSAKEVRVMTVHVFDVQQVLDHPRVGRQAWLRAKRAGVHDNEGEGGDIDDGAEDEAQEEVGATDEANWSQTLTQHGLFYASDATIHLALTAMAALYDWLVPSDHQGIAVPLLRVGCTAV